MAASRERPDEAPRGVRSLFASPRRRRRLAWALALAGVFGSVVLSMVVFTGPTDDAGPSPAAGPGWLAPEEPRAVAPTRDRVAASLDVARRFIQTAVARKDVGRSWRLVSPDLRAGFTRAEWAGGDIPIIPYPVESARWELDYSYADTIGFQVALFPLPGRKVRPTVFNVDLRAFGEGKGRRWLVDGFTPGVVRGLPSGAGPGGQGAERSLAGADLAPRNRGEARLGAAWLAVPLGVLGLAVLIPISVGLLNWQRVRRAERDFGRERAGL